MDWMKQEARFFVVFFQKRNSESLLKQQLSFWKGLYGLGATVQLQMWESAHRSPKLGINLTLTHHTMASEITGARCAISDKCSVADFNTPLSLLFSHLLWSPLRSLSVKWHTGERAKRLCLLTGASEHLKWQRVTLAWVLQKMPQSKVKDH